MWISIEEVLCFQAVMTEGSISSASQRLNKAKSAVRYSINKLEEQLGFLLFKRGKYRLEPTRRGKEFFEKTQSLIDEAQRLEGFADQMKSGQELNLSLSCTELYSLTKFNRILKEVLRKFPKTEIRFQREILSGERMLNQGLVDLALFGEIKNREKYEIKEIEEVELKLVMAKDHPIFKKKLCDDVLVSDLYAYPQIVQRSTIPSEESSGVHDKAVKWYVSDTLTKKQIIIDGLGWGRLPDHEVDNLIESGKLIHLSHLKDDDRTVISICRRKAYSHGSVSDYIWNLF